MYIANFSFLLPSFSFESSTNCNSKKLHCMWKIRFWWSYREWISYHTILLYGTWQYSWRWGQRACVALENNSITFTQCTGWGSPTWLSQPGLARNLISYITATRPSRLNLGTNCCQSSSQVVYFLLDGLPGRVAPCKQVAIMLLQDWKLFSKRKAEPLENDNRLMALAATVTFSKNFNSRRWAWRTARFHAVPSLSTSPTTLPSHQVRRGPKKQGMWLQNRRVGNALVCTRILSHWMLLSTLLRWNGKKNQAHQHLAMKVKRFACLDQ